MRILQKAGLRSFLGHASHTAIVKATPMQSGDLTKGIDWPDAVTTVLQLLFPIPDDYISGDLTFRIFRRGAAVGSAEMRINTFRFRDATAFNQMAVNDNVDFAPGNVNSHMLTVVIASTDFGHGDNVRVDLSRIGADSGDTMAALVEFDGAWVEYRGLK